MEVYDTAMKDLMVRIFSVLLIVIALIGYNMTVQVREKDNEIAKINSQLQYSKQEAEYYKTQFIELSGIEEENKESESKYNDGIYEGTAMGFGGDITVSVEIENGSIKSINVTKASGEDGAYLEMAKDIINNIIEAGDADVDTVSGATFSSTGIKNATIEALSSAEK